MIQCNWGNPMGVNAIFCRRTLNFIFVVSFVTYSTGSSDLRVTLSGPLINKCCPENELLFGKYLDHCRHVNETDSNPWSPLFYDPNGCVVTDHVDYRIVPGIPNCGTRQRLPVYEYPGSQDRIMLRLDGSLRHYTNLKSVDEDELRCIRPISPLGERLYYDHNPGEYCLDKALEGGGESYTAIVCVPSVATPWRSETVLRRIVDPILRVVGICCLLAVSVIYFILPHLRDLVGNMLSTIALSLLVSQVASLVRIFTEFSSHVSFMVADVVMYLSLMAAFFWLTNFGYYIWRTIRSRNIFLRVSDGRKYCYYSTCAWGTVLVMTFIALLAHFLFDSDKSFALSPHDQETIGWLGVAVFFTPIAFSILFDLFFYLSTAQAISRIPSYGHIHEKLKFSFRLFIQIFIVMSISWTFLLLSWLQYDGLVFANIIVNALQAPLILTICVISPKRVRNLLKKTYCQGDRETYWGDEMMSMTSG